MFTFSVSTPDAATAAYTLTTARTDRITGYMVRVTHLSSQQQQDPLEAVAFTVTAVVPGQAGAFSPTDRLYCFAMMADICFSLKLSVCLSVCIVVQTLRSRSGTIRVPANPSAERYDPNMDVVFVLQPQPAPAAIAMDFMSVDTESCCDFVRSSKLLSIYLTLIIFYILYRSWCIMALVTAVHPRLPLSVSADSTTTPTCSLSAP